MNTQELMAKRRDKIIAVILSFKEKECDPYLPPEVRTKLRKVVLDQINDLHDLYSDIISSDTDVVINELFLQKLDDIYSAVQDIQETK